MIPRINLVNLPIDRSPEALAANREKTLERLAKWRLAHDRLQRVCKKLGIEVPVLHG